MANLCIKLNIFFLYSIAFPSESLIIELSSVALVKLDAGAEFSSLQTASDNTRLYIDLNQGQVGDEDNLNILGFNMKRNIFFITNTQRIRLQEVIYTYTVSAQIERRRSIKI